MRTETLTPEAALRLVKNVLPGFRILCQTIPVQAQDQNLGNSTTLTTVTIRSGQNAEISTNQPLNGEEKFFQVQPTHIYRLIWHKRLFLIAFYSSPEIYGYYSTVTPSKHYTFCSVIEMQNELHKRAEVNFSFNSKTRRFLELFDADFYIHDDFVRECRDTNSLEVHFINRILY